MRIIACELLKNKSDQNLIFRATHHSWPSFACNSQPLAMCPVIASVLPPALPPCNKLASGA